MLEHLYELSSVKMLSGERWSFAEVVAGPPAPVQH